MTRPSTSSSSTDESTLPPELPLEGQEERTAEEFTAFRTLPPELRLHIWRATLPGPRVVRVRVDLDLMECRSSTPLPVALHVSQESRLEAKRFYTLSFGPRDDQDPEEPNRAPGGRIYFDFGIDTFFFFTQLESQTSERAEGMNTGSETLVPASQNSMDDFETFSAIVMATEQINQIRKLAMNIDLFLACIRIHYLRAEGTIIPFFEHFPSNCVGHFYMGTPLEKLASKEMHQVQAIDEKLKARAMKKHDTNNSNVEGDADGADGAGDEFSQAEFATLQESLELITKAVEHGRKASGFEWLAAYLI